MKWTIVLAILLGSQTLSLVPAHAGDEGWAALGGFIGGALLNEVVHHRGKRSVGRYAPPVHSGGCAPSRTTRHPAPPPAHYAHAAPAPRGHWEARTQKVWVPGRYIHQATPCGGYQKVWQSGYWDKRTQRVWVEDVSGGHYRR